MGRSVRWSLFGPVGHELFFFFIKYQPPTGAWEYHRPHCCTSLSCTTVRTAARPYCCPIIILFFSITYRGYSTNLFFSAIHTGRQLANFGSTTSFYKIDLRKHGKRESVSQQHSIKNRRAVGLLNPMRDKNQRQEPGGRRDDTYL